MGVDNEELDISLWILGLWMYLFVCVLAVKGG